MDGFDSLRELRKEFTGIPVIAQTAYAYISDIRKIEEAGFTDYIIKPVNAEDLYVLLKKHLKSERLR